MKKQKIIEIKGQTLHKATLIFSLCCIILAIIILVSVFVVENIKPEYSYREVDQTKYDVLYRSIYIEADKNVWEISEDIRKESKITGKLISTKNQSDEIIRLNNLNKNGDIKYGNYIVVPYIVKKGGE